MTDGLVVLDRVSKRYGNIQALDNVSFSIGRGEIFGYIGPNGAGKTTTIRIMVGLLRDFEGAVSIGDHPIADKGGDVQRMLGYLPQDVAFQEWRTVDHALTTFGRLNGLGKEELALRIPEVLALVGLPEERHRKIVHLSGGMVQKLGLAQALLHSPPLIVLDEPLAGLDPASRYQVKNIIRELSRKGTTVFFSSHILSDVQDVATRIGILSWGRLGLVGTVEELKAYFGIEKDIEVFLSKDSGRWKELESIEGVKSIEQTAPNRLFVRLEKDADMDEATHKLIHGLLSVGCQIRSFYPASPSLEQLYIRYVGGEHP
ncbi:MAG: ABC transporter ATP-binding protein [Methanobacteriota archaeon]|nr:MAG: ABC transporter ATP-binding protein [Euryarchaeota archaeon]